MKSELFMSENEVSISRCPHDSLNPYAQISRKMLADRSISPKAKGVLSYLLSLPNDWKIYHSQLQYALNVGEDYINSSMEELIHAGYADRTRERVKGIFQPYRYNIREFKKSLPDRENPPGSEPEINREETTPQHVLNQTGLAGPGNPVILKKELKEKEILQNKSASPVVVSPFLNRLDISENLKIKITKEYSTPEIEIAVTRCLRWKNRESDEAGIMICLTRADSWNDTPTLAEKQSSNIDFLNSLKYLDSKVIGRTTIVIGNKYIEFVAGMKSIVYDISDTELKRKVSDHIQQLKRII
jgi:hypothetical protein